MEQAGPQTPALDVPSPAAADQAAADARRVFVRTLASWTSDLLLLDRRGLRELTWPTGRAGREADSKAA